MPLQSDYQDVTRGYLKDWGVQTPSPLVVCELLRAYEGRFCFDWGQATYCEKISITIKSGDSITGSAGFEYGGGSIGVEVSHTQETEISYETDPCAICQPVMCYQGRMLIYECERFLGFWSWTTIDTVWSPSSRGMLSLNCVKSKKCGCKDSTAVSSLDSRVSLGGEAQWSRVVRESSVKSVGEPGTSDVETNASLFARHIEDIATQPTTGFERSPHKVAFANTAGRVNWIHDSSMQSKEFQVTLLAINNNGSLRSRMRIDESFGGIIPIMAVAPCREEVSAIATVDVLLPGKSNTKRIASIPVFVSTGFVTSMYTEADVSDLPPGTTGVITLQAKDNQNSCLSRSVSEPFVISGVPKSEC